MIETMMPPKKTKTERLNLVVEKSLNDRLKLANDETGVPISEIVRRAVDAWLIENGY